MRVLNSTIRNIMIHREKNDDEKKQCHFFKKLVHLVYVLKE